MMLGDAFYRKSLTLGIVQASLTLHSLTRDFQRRCFIIRIIRRLLFGDAFSVTNYMQYISRFEHPIGAIKSFPKSLWSPAIQEEGDEGIEDIRNPHGNHRRHIAIDGKRR